MGRNANKHPRNKRSPQQEGVRKSTHSPSLCNPPGSCCLLPHRRKLRFILCGWPLRQAGHKTGPEHGSAETLWLRQVVRTLGTPFPRGPLEYCSYTNPYTRAFSVHFFNKFVCLFVCLHPRQFLFSQFLPPNPSLFPPPNPLLLFLVRKRQVSQEHQQHMEYQAAGRLSTSHVLRLGKENQCEEQGPKRQ